MLAILDTDHYVALVASATLASRLCERANMVDADLVLSIVTPQEITQGWLAVINRERAGPDQVLGYHRFHHSLLGFPKLSILPFDEEAANRFLWLQRQRLRVGTMDLKIASICLAQDALLLTRNLVDFDRVPGLRVEDWLD